MMQLMTRQEQLKRAFEKGRVAVREDYFRPTKDRPEPCPYKQPQFAYAWFNGAYWELYPENRERVRGAFSPYLDC